MLALVILCLSSCKKWEAPEFKAPEYTGPKANKTIADIKAKHTVFGQNVLDSICQYQGQKFIVKAVVVSSDEGGNCYKYLTIQDKTGGMEIAIDQTGLFNEFPVGQIVYLNCDGLVTGDYHNKPQVGWIYENSIGRINYMMLNKYLSRDGLPSLDNINDPEFSPCGGGICEINSNTDVTDELINCLCVIKNARFSPSCHGLQLATNESTCNRDLANFDYFTVRTSNYAKFRNIIIDANKEYNLTGILSKYNKTYQFTLRTAEDMQEIVQGPPQPQETEVLVQGMTFDANSFTSGGWSQTGSAWTYQSSGEFMQHDASSMCDDWLISPEITIDQSDCYLKVEHILRQNLSPSIDQIYYQVYYSTTYQGGAVNPDDWQAYQVNVYPANYFGFCNALTPVPEGSFRIAFRYHKPSGAPVGLDAWAIRKLNFYKKEWR